MNQLAFIHVLASLKCAHPTPPAEWAQLLLDHAGEAAAPLSKSEVAGLRRRLRERAESLRALEEDLAFVNGEIDLYNLQVSDVPYHSLSLLSPLPQDEDDDAVIDSLLEPRD